jgi:hypothetical protein
MRSSLRRLLATLLATLLAKFYLYEFYAKSITVAYISITVLLYCIVLL